MRRSVPSWAQGGSLAQRRALVPPPARQPQRQHAPPRAEPLRESDQRAGRGIATGAQRCQQDGQKDRDPLIGFALAHAEQAPLDHLERRGFQGDEDEALTIFRRRERTVLVHGEPAGHPRSAIETPRRQMCLERGHERWDQLLKLVARQARPSRNSGGRACTSVNHIRAICGASFQGRPSIP
jgi:hypothetical protein